jgi:CRP/FNR family transcriptional regulator
MSSPANAPVTPLRDGRVECRDCALFQLCLPTGINQTDLEMLDRIIRRRRPVKRGESLYRAGDAFGSLYAVKSGSFKTFSFTEDGREQVTGLHLPGELFGMEAISAGTHCCSAAALERSSVCEIPFERLEALGAQVPNLMRQFVRIMSKEILRDKRIMQMTKSSADGRLAAFLLNLSERYRERGFSAREYRLSMSRIDIGNYLGLADETVSRLFTRFQEAGLLETDRKQVRLLDIPRLQALARRPVARSLPGSQAVHDAIAARPMIASLPEDSLDANLLVWAPQYDIGVAAVDRQHRRLFDLSNRFYQAACHRARRAALHRVFDELLEYAGYHFAEEERLMEQIDYPHLMAHRAHHVRLAEQVRRYRAQLRAGVGGAEAQAAGFLKMWLHSHVLDADRQIGAFLQGSLALARERRQTA